MSTRNCPQCGLIVLGAGAGFGAFGCCTWNCSEKFQSSSDANQQYAAKFSMVQHELTKLASLAFARGFESHDIKDALQGMAGQAFDTALAKVRNAW